MEDFSSFPYRSPLYNGQSKDSRFIEFQLYSFHCHAYFLDPPSIVSGLTNETVNETHNLRLLCIATGNPQPHITWSKRSDPTPIKSVDGVLTVKNVNKTNSGVYQCKVSNGVGKDAIASSVVTVNCKLQVLTFFLISSFIPGIVRAVA